MSEKCRMSRELERRIFIMRYVIASLPRAFISYSVIVSSTSECYWTRRGSLLNLSFTRLRSSIIENSTWIKCRSESFATGLFALAAWQCNVCNFHFRVAYARRTSGGWHWKESQSGSKGLGGATRTPDEMLTPTLNAAARNAWRWARQARAREFC